MQTGYVYLLINPSMPGLVKVGRTARPVAERLAELSAATGVPTPFELVFEVLVGDCVSAEAAIHEHLSQRGYRVSQNREFFQAPIREVLSLLTSLRPAPSPAPLDGLELSAVGTEMAAAPLQAPVRLQDPLFRHAAEFAADRSTVSTADLMRAFNVGFSRAQSLVDELVWAGMLERDLPYRTRASLSSQPVRPNEPRAALGDSIGRSLRSRLVGLMRWFAALGR